MLSVAPDASADEIKRAFRREIARYHPDKVQHLGAEFQEMAASIAADLTEAYRILMDPALRAKYDEELKGGHPAALERPSAQPARRPEPPPVAPSPPPPRTERPQGPSAGAGLEFVKKAALSRLRTALEQGLGQLEPVRLQGFDLSVVSKPKKSLFKKGDEPICLAVKFVPFVDAQAVADVWTDGLRAKAPGVTGCVVLLLGSRLAEANELAAAVTEQRRKTRAASLTLVPVDVRDWEALFPPETPGGVRSVIQTLKEAKR